MAKNLQSKLQPTDKIALYDINADAMKSLEVEMKAGSGAAVELSASAHDAAKEAVCTCTRGDDALLTF